MRLLAFVCRGDEQTYRLPLPEDVKRPVDDLKQALGEQTTEPLDEFIHPVFLALFQHRWMPSEDNEMPDPSVRFLALATLSKALGKHLPPSHATRQMAGLQYIIRLVFLEQIHRQTEDSTHGDQLRECNALSVHFTEDRPTTFGLLRSLTHYATYLAQSSERMPQFYWPKSGERDSVFFSGVEIKLDHIRSLAHELETTAADIWERELFMDSGWRIDYGDAIVDKLHCTMNHYSIFAEPDNAKLYDVQAVLTEALAIPKLAARLLKVFPGSTRAVWIVAHCKAWLRSLAKLEKLLLLLLLITAGGQPRASEVCAMAVCNTPGRDRNFYVLGRHACIIGGYHKGSQMTGKDKRRPHAMGAVTSDLFIQVHGAARRLAMAMSQYCFGDDSPAQEGYTKYAFVDFEGKPFTTRAVSEEMVSWTKRHLAMPVTVRPCRQLLSVFRRASIVHGGGESPDKDDDHGEDDYDYDYDDHDDHDEDTVPRALIADALQDTHGFRVGERLYGNTSDGFCGIGGARMAIFTENSAYWQIVLHCVPGGTLLPYREALPQHFELQRRKLGFQPVKLSSSSSSLTLSLQDVIRQTIIKETPLALREMERSLKETIAREVAQATAPLLQSIATVQQLLQAMQRTQMQLLAGAGAASSLSSGEPLPLQASQQPPKKRRRRDALDLCPDPEELPTYHPDGKHAATPNLGLSPPLAHSASPQCTLPCPLLRQSSRLQRGRGAPPPTMVSHSRGGRL